MNRCLLGIACVLLACAGKKETEKGPKIIAALVGESGSGDSVDSREPPGRTISLGSGDADYSIIVRVESDTDGYDVTEGQETKREEYPATAATAKVALDGVDVPVGPLAPSDKGGRKAFESQPFKLPGATSKGKKLTLHAEATDSRSLHSNAVDVTATLD